MTVVEALSKSCPDSVDSAAPARDNESDIASAGQAPPPATRQCSVRATINGGPNQDIRVASAANVTRRPASSITEHAARPDRAVEKPDSHSVGPGGLWLPRDPAANEEPLATSGVTISQQPIVSADDTMRSLGNGLASTEPDAPRSEAVERYAIRNGRFCYLDRDGKGQKVTRWLSNFAAHIDEEITYDDGAELRREFRVSGRLDTGESLPVARITTSELAAFNWTLREWGSRAVVFASQREALRTALQVVSWPTRRRIFSHTGWTEHEGRPVFLFHGGAVGAAGIEVDLPAPLDRFHLPSAALDVQDAVRCSLSLLDCGAPEITAPLLAAVYLAPLSSILNPDTSIWLYGPSGSLKSTVSALAQAHFGDFDRKTLSASWTSTDNALEARLHILKDVLAVIDDYAPQEDSRAQSELDRRVQRVLRDVGNRAGRSRLGGDLRQRPDRPPRGFLICSGEGLPPGHSINARLVHVEVDKHRLDLDAITELQARVDRLPHAMRGYLDWVSKRLGDLRSSLPATRNELRAQLQRGGLHMRQPEALANLYLGIDVFLRFALDVGAVTDPHAGAIRASTLAAFRIIAMRQAANLGTLDPTELFVDALTTNLLQGRLKLLHVEEGMSPDDPDVIGWRRGEVALILPAVVYRRLATLTRGVGGIWGPSPRELHRALVERGYLLATRDGRNAGQWRVGPNDRKQRGWLLRLDAVLPGGVASLIGERAAAAEEGE